MAKFYFIMTLMILQGNFLSYGQPGSGADGSGEQGPSVEDESGMGSGSGTNPSGATDSGEDASGEEESGEDESGEDGSGIDGSGVDGSSSGEGQGTNETAPKEVLPTPREPSPKEREEAVQFSIPLKSDFKWDFETDDSFKKTMASVTTDFCTKNRTRCALKEARRKRRSPELYTADEVHLLPGYPSNASGSLQVAFYVQQPLGQIIGNISVLPRSTLVEIVKNHKSAIETAIGANISDVEFFFKPATPITPTTPVRAEQLESSSNVGKWAAIGVFVGVVIIIVIIFIVFRWMKSKAPNLKISHRSPGLEGGDAWGSYNFYES